MTNTFSENLILTHVGFDKNKKPLLKFADMETGEIISFNPEFHKNITLEFDTTSRFCIGWHSLETGEDFACPEKTQVDEKYDQCQKCQKRTGFNPAFYNAAASDMSEQQQKRNAMPHIVYLAHFSDGIIKVGISFAGRGIARLLEQGARSALILGEFPSANIARNYEAEISSMDGFCENVKATAKLKMLEKPYSFEQANKQLLDAKRKIEADINVKFDENQVLSLDKFYSEDQIPNDNILSVCDFSSSDKTIFSGELIAQIGYILLAKQQDENLVIPVKKFTGYRVKISDNLTEIELPERQVSLFDF